MFKPVAEGVPSSVDAKHSPRYLIVAAGQDLAKLVSLQHSNRFEFLDAIKTLSTGSLAKQFPLDIAAEASVVQKSGVGGF